ncbi:Unknown protein [Striga hermonthica]|uniref:Reverse transcriptase zinc-binding domain-containing protein n=1 Tax=Striga hermonthica TaxID=68872 RepID=A0A9N7R545_STRHE|nr:Unknown protein [Striga hermonthica]
MTCGDGPLGSQPLWRAIWQSPGPQCIRIFLWLLTKNRLLTNAGSSRRNLTDSTLCVKCDHTEETTLHVVCDCQLAAKIWRRFFPVWKLWKWQNELIFRRARDVAMCVREIHTYIDGLTKMLGGTKELGGRADYEFLDGFDGKELC